MALKTAGGINALSRSSSLLPEMRSCAGRKRSGAAQTTRKKETDERTAFLGASPICAPKVAHFQILNKLFSSFYAGAGRGRLGDWARRSGVWLLPTPKRQAGNAKDQFFWAPPSPVSPCLCRPPPIFPPIVRTGGLRVPISSERSDLRRGQGGTDGRPETASKDQVRQRVGPTGAVRGPRPFRAGPTDAQGICSAI